MSREGPLSVRMSALERSLSRETRAREALERRVKDLEGRERVYRADLNAFSGRLGEAVSRLERLERITRELAEGAESLGKYDAMVLEAERLVVLLADLLAWSALDQERRRSELLGLVQASSSPRVREMAEEYKTEGRE